LRAWLPLTTTIVPQVDCSATTSASSTSTTSNTKKRTRNKKADFLISCQHPPYKVIVELLANERFSHTVHGVEQDSSMLGHITRTKQYADSHHIPATSAWVVHFIGVKAFPTSVEFPETPECCCAYVLHLHDFTQFKLITLLPDNTSTEKFVNHPSSTSTITPPPTKLIMRKATGSSYTAKKHQDDTKAKGDKKKKQEKAKEKEKKINDIDQSRDEKISGPGNDDDQDNDFQ